VQPRVENEEVNFEGALIDSSSRKKCFDPAASLKSDFLQISNISKEPANHGFAKN
jgi:hypothetical protein